MFFPGLSQDLELRLYQSCIQKVKSLEESASEKKKLDILSNRLHRNNYKSEIGGLGPTHLANFRVILEVLIGLKKGFDEVTKIEEYSSFIKSDFNIINYFIDILPIVPIPKEKIDIESVYTKFYVILITNFKKAVVGIPTKFPQQWGKRAKEIIKEDHQKLQKLRYQQPQKQQQKKKFQPTIPTTQYQRQKQMEAEPSESEQDDSEESPQPPKRVEQERLKQFRERDYERDQRENDKRQRAQRQNQQREKEDIRRRREQDQRRADHRQQSKGNKSKIQLVQKYLATRRDLTFEKGKNKEVAEFLASKLDQFMKHTVEQLYNIANLKNRKNLKFGNQLGYFAQENRRVQNQSEFYFQPNSKIYSLSYKNKHQIYNNLRMKEVKKEDELRNALETKINEGEKKIDKKIENYILKPRPKETEAFLVPYREEKQIARGLSSSVPIALQHVIFYLQDHAWLKNSMLLFHVYHRF